MPDLLGVRHIDRSMWQGMLPNELSVHVFARRFLP
jgi:hypothetical protein